MKPSSEARDPAEQPGHVKKNCPTLGRKTDLKQKDVARQPKPKARVAQGNDVVVMTPFAFATHPTPTAMKPTNWIVDSGASSHMCSDEAFFNQLKPITGMSVALADGRVADVAGKGTGNLFCKDDQELDANLISVGQLTDKGALVTFDASKCVIQHNGSVAGVAAKGGGLYHLNMVQSMMVRARVSSIGFLIRAMKKEAERGRTSSQEPKKGIANAAGSGVTFVLESDGAKHDGKSSSQFHWILDSGASEHMVHTADCLQDVVKQKQPVPIVVASGKVVYGRYSGSIKITSLVGGRRIDYVVNDVLYVPELQYNLFSIRCVGKLGMRVTFEDEAVEISRGGEVVATGKLSGKLYVLNAIMERGSVDEALVSLPVDEYELWHRRFGHIGKSGLKTLMRDEMVSGMALKKEAFRGNCRKDNGQRKDFLPQWNKN
nr:uncharacterized protein LOC115256104 [Aedes albopictus]